jgi:acetyl-CoA C-acetyltransferase
LAATEERIPVLTEERIPVLVGAGEVVQRDADPREAQEPLALMERAARLAFEDAGSSHDLAGRIDAVGVVDCLSWRYANPCRRLAESLGVRARLEIATGMGGNSPQLLVNEVARRIRRGELRAALLAGAEAVRTRYLAHRGHTKVPWPADASGAPPGIVLGANRPGTSELETAHGLVLPPHVYPLFENALRARSGASLAAHAERVGRILSRMTEVASGNPTAWFRTKRSPEEIVRVSSENRMIAFPYTKYMNAILEVDQGAALLVTSAAEARALGIPKQRWIHVAGGGEATEEPWFATERPRFDASPALRHAALAALAQAGVPIDAMDALDLYSCFPCAVEIACEELGIDPLGARPLTVTGGLPYHGGPGNAYSLHAIARMAERLRAAPGSRGLVTALGWYLTKHAAGVYSSGEPGEVVPDSEGGATPQPKADPVPLALRPDGVGTVETYTVLYERDGTPARGIVVGRLGDGRRFVANTPGEREVLEALVAREAVGLRGRVRVQGDRNLFDPDGPGARPGSGAAP